jgi:hypothetical protein
MTTANRPNHSDLAEALRRAVLEGPGVTDATLRRAVAETAAGELTAKAPYDELARQIEAAADRVRDEQVAAVLKAAGSEKAAFEIIAASAVGAGLFRWRQAIKAIAEVSDAPA